MKNILKMFSHNWGIKLLALMLALIVYYSMKVSINSSGLDTVTVKGSFNGRSQNSK